MTVKPQIMAGGKPDPDPTVMTTAQLEKAIINSEALMEARFNAVITRMDAMDKAVTIVHEDFVRVPTLLDRAIQNIRELVEERIAGKTALLEEKITSLGNVTTQQFISIADKFAEKDKAVAVGLETQSKFAAAVQESNTAATAKMESNFSELLKQGRELLAETRKNTESQMANINSRLDRGEGQSKGARDFWGYVVGAGGLLVGLSVLFSHWR